MGKEFTNAVYNLTASLEFQRLVHTSSLNHTCHYKAVSSFFSDMEDLGGRSNILGIFLSLS